MIVNSEHLADEAFRGVRPLKLPHGARPDVVRRQSQEGGLRMFPIALETVTQVCGPGHNVLVGIPGIGHSQNIGNERLDLHEAQCAALRADLLPEA